jgi:50S ribosomal subunit-associated GTPase HflX
MKLAEVREGPDIIPISAKEKESIKHLKARIESILRQQGLEPPKW